MFDRLDSIDRLFTGSEDMELGCTVVHSFLPLGFGARENNNVTSHGNSQLNGQMSEAADTHDSNSVACGDSISAQDRPDSSSGTHEGSRMGGIVALWNGIDTLLIPNGARAESSVVKIVETVLLLIPTVLVPTC
jgi:hypothetical protein